MAKIDPRVIKIAIERALAAPCLLPEETVLEGFSHASGDWNYRLTLNSGYDEIDADFGGPVWHVSAKYRYGLMPASAVEMQAEAFLEGLGDADAGEWRQSNPVNGICHIRRRVSADEHTRLGIGELRDLRGTKEERQRLRALKKAVTPELWRLMQAAFDANNEKEQP